MSTLSVCTICLNEEEPIVWYLDCCAYLAATLPNLQEVILVDGGSTDNTIDVINSYRDRVPITLLQHPFDTFGEQKNRALVKATGDFIFGPDADMTWTRNFSDVFASGQYASAAYWDFQMKFTAQDKYHYFHRWPQGVNMRLWKRGPLFVTNFHEKLQGQTQGIPVCSHVTIFENSRRIGDQAALA